MPYSLGDVQVGVWEAWGARLGLGELDPFLERMKDMTSRWTFLTQYLVPSEYFCCMPYCSAMTLYMHLLPFLSIWSSLAVCVEFLFGECWLEIWTVLSKLAERNGKMGKVMIRQAQHT